MPMDYGNASMYGIGPQHGLSQDPAMSGGGGGFMNFLKRMLMARLGVQTMDPNEIALAQMKRKWQQDDATLAHNRLLERDEFQAGLGTPELSPGQKKTEELEAILRLADEEALKSGPKGSPAYVSAYRFNKALLRGSSPGAVLNEGQMAGIGMGGLSTQFADYESEQSPIASVEPEGSMIDHSMEKKPSWFERVMMRRGR